MVLSLELVVFSHGCSLESPIGRTFELLTGHTPDLRDQNFHNYPVIQMYSQTGNQPLLKMCQNPKKWAWPLGESSPFLTPHLGTHLSVSPSNVPCSGKGSFSRPHLTSVFQVQDPAKAHWKGLLPPPGRVQPSGLNKNGSPPLQIQKLRQNHSVT